MHTQCRQKHCGNWKNTGVKGHTQEYISVKMTFYELFFTQHQNRLYFSNASMKTMCVPVITDALTDSKTTHCMTTAHMNNYNLKTSFGYYIRIPGGKIDILL